MSAVKFGFIGTGNMGGALARAVANAVGSEELLLADRSESKARLLAEEIGCNFSDSISVAAEARYIFLGVKPQAMQAAVEKILPVLKQRKDRFILVTMAAGIKISDLCQMLGGSYPVIRIMPNTPVSVGKGMILYTPNSEVFSEELSDFCVALRCAGKTDRIDEGLIDAAAALSGCGPAFAYIFAESLADGAVACGLPRQKANEYAAQMLLGSAELLLSSGKHSAQLKDEVCSPAGTTIAGVGALEAGGFRAAAMAAVKAAFDRTAELG